MSPRVHNAGITWWVIGPAVGLWLAAVIVLSAAASPATAGDASTTIPAAAAVAVAVADTSEAPILTLLVAAVGISAVAARPARRVVARRRVR